MHLFWDTSAVVPLIFQEPHTERAHRALAQGQLAFAWSWMRIEAEAALLRRRAGSEHWRELNELLSAFIWLVMNPSEESALCQLNRPLGLRALDAGHLYVCSRAMAADPAIQLVSFDHEIQSAAMACSLPLWT
jgi:predicted nucleic acid-binding protein